MNAPTVLRFVDRLIGMESRLVSSGRHAPDRLRTMAQCHNLTSDGFAYRLAGEVFALLLECDEGPVPEISIRLGLHQRHGLPFAVDDVCVGEGAVELGYGDTEASVRDVMDWHGITRLDSSVRFDEVRRIVRLESGGAGIDSYAKAVTSDWAKVRAYRKAAEAIDYDEHDERSKQLLA